MGGVLFPYKGLTEQMFGIESDVDTGFLQSLC